MRAVADAGARLDGRPDSARAHPAPRRPGIACFFWRRAFAQPPRSPPCKRTCAGGRAWHLFVSRPETLTHDQRVQARKEAGVGTPAEVASFLEALPRPLTLALRTQGASGIRVLTRPPAAGRARTDASRVRSPSLPAGLVRNVAEGLGVSRPRRMQLLLQEASEGLTWRHGRPGPPPSVIVSGTNQAVEAVFRLGVVMRVVRTFLCERSFWTRRLVMVAHVSMIALFPTARRW